MNVTCEMIKDMKKWGNRWKWFVFVARNCARFWSFEVHNNINAESAIEKLQQIAREKEA
jgi:hypothetical protein